MTHSEEGLALLNEQVAEMCRYLGLTDADVLDSWSLRDAIVALNARALSAEHAIDFEYGYAAGPVPPDTFKWETFS